MATATPKTFTDLYPGRFLTSEHFDGKKVTLTVAEVVGEILESPDKKKAKKVVVSFAGTEMQMVMPQTNGYCMKEMFGNKIADWIGKKVTFFPTTCRFGADPNVPCIRIWGSPDIARDLDVKIPMGMQKPVHMTLHAMKTATAGASALSSATTPPPAQDTKPTQSDAEVEVDPKVAEIWGILGWTRAEGVIHQADFTGDIEEYLARLNALVDEANAREGAA